MTFVELEVALAASGLRLVVMAGAPSPWSQAALAIVRYKKLACVVARTHAGAPAFKQWGGARNVPAALMDGEPVRTGWAEILALTERLAPDAPLVPSVPRERARMMGLASEILGEGGLFWSVRLLSIDAGLTTDGREGSPLAVARYLAPRYGWSPGCAGAARARAVEALSLLDAELRERGGLFYAGDTITALDLYSAAAMNALVPLPDVACPMAPTVRALFTWMGATLGDAVTPGLLAHRDRVVARTMPLPLEL